MSPCLLTIIIASVLMAGALLYTWIRFHTQWVIENSLRPTHFMQAFAQLSVYIYWSFFYAGVAAWAPLILYQLIFAFAFHFLVSIWTRRKFVLGFSVFPIVFSINLFMWARPDYFYLQLLLIVIAILSKTFLVREIRGRISHIFNPSAFAMALVALLVLIPHWNFLLSAREVVQSWLLVPGFFIFVFVAGSVSQWVGRVSLVAFGAVFALVILDLVSRALFGMPAMLTMLDRNVFIGCTLLVTDPATSPKTPVAQFLFGICYGVGIVLCYALLGLAGRDKFYDKILIVPILNYFAPKFDEWFGAWAERAKPLWDRRVQFAAYAVFFALALPGIDHKIIEFPNLLSANKHFVVEPAIREPLKQYWTAKCSEDPESIYCQKVAAIF